MTSFNSTSLVKMLLIVSLLVVPLTLCIHSARAQDEEPPFTLVIISPGDGEILYSGRHSYNVSIPVTGQVYLPGRPLTDVSIQLEVWSEEERTTTLTTQPDENGFFVFYLELNPDNKPLPSAGERYFYYSVSCHDCHFQTEADLPAGDVRFVITATTPGGEQVMDQRRVIVDRSGLVTLPIQVTFEGAERTLPSGLPIQADTRLYDWRARTFKGTSDAEGTLQLEVEALSQRVTHYLVSLPPTVIGGTLYQTVKSVQVELPPGVTQVAPISLAVQALQASITGSVVAPMDTGGTAFAIQAIALPGGLVYREQTSPEGIFQFENLPVGEYLLTVDLKEWSSNVEAPLIHLDLRKNLSANVQLDLEKIATVGIHGRLLDESGAPLPFGWIIEEDGGRVSLVSPLDGTFSVHIPPGGRIPVYAIAPGYWSQALIAQSNHLLEVQLSPRPGTQYIDWGDGNIKLPQETIASISKNSLTIIRGWVWGHNTQQETFTIHLSGAQIELQAADFILEHTPEGISWLIVVDGVAALLPESGMSIPVLAGEMISFGDEISNPQPVPADPGVILQLLRYNKSVSPLPFEIEPSLSTRLRSEVSRLGTGLAQAITFATYVISIFLVIGVPLFAARNWLNARKQ